MSTMSEWIGEAAAAVSLASAVPRLLRDSIARVAAMRERRAVGNRLAGASDRDLADIGLDRSQSHQVLDFTLARAWDTLHRVTGEPAEGMLADPGLSRTLPRPGAGDCDDAAGERPAGCSRPDQGAEILDMGDTPMKATLRVAAAAPILVAATAAHAGECYDDEPFPFRAPGVTVVNPSARTVDTGLAAYPDLTGRPSWVVTAGGPDEVPITSSESTIQSANSLPRGAMDDTVAYAQDRSVRRYLAQQVVASARIARTAQVPNRKPGG